MGSNPLSGTEMSVTDYNKGFNAAWELMRPVLELYANPKNWTVPHDYELWDIVFIGAEFDGNDPAVELIAKVQKLLKEQVDN